MADYDGELVFPRAFLTASLPHLHERVILDPSAPSGVRVLGKSLYLIAAGWVISVAWLWVEAVQQHLRRNNVPPPDIAGGTIVGGIVPALLMAAAACAIARYAGRAPHATLERREWWHALWWSLLPNALLLGTVWLMTSA